MRFEYILIMTVCFLVICPSSFVLAIREACKKRFGFFAVMLGVFSINFFLSVAFLNMAIQLAPSSPAVISNLPYLKINLSNPIKGVQYRIDGAVVSIREHEIKILEEMNYEKNDIFMLHKENDYDSIVGNCLVVKNAFRQIAITMWEEREGVNSEFTAVHEEMHVIQAFKISEAFENIRNRFRLLGFIVDFKSFSYEEQADLAGILIFLEKGYTTKEIELKIAPDSTQAIAKLMLSKKNSKKDAT